MALRAFEVGDMSDSKITLDRALPAFCEAWSTHEADAVLALWDMTDSQCSWLSARGESRLFGPAAVTELVTAALRTHARIRLRPRAVHARVIGDGLGAFFAEVDWAFWTTVDGRPEGGTFRVSGVLREGGPGFRLCHYAESPLAPIVELRQFYQQVAAEGHEGMT